MTSPLPSGYIAHLPPPKHVLGEEKRIPSTESLSGREEIHKTCRNCGSIRITVIGQGDYSGIARRWMLKDDLRRFSGEPVCQAAE
jgi:hypothetical protein